MSLPQLLCSPYIIRQAAAASVPEIDWRGGYTVDMLLADEAPIGYWFFKCQTLYQNRYGNNQLLRGGRRIDAYLMPTHTQFCRAGAAGDGNPDG